MFHININFNNNNTNIYPPIHINSSKNQSRRNFLVRTLLHLIFLAFFSLLLL